MRRYLHVPRMIFLASYHRALTVKVGLTSLNTLMFPGIWQDLSSMLSSKLSTERGPRTVLGHFNTETYQTITLAGQG